MPPEASTSTAEKPERKTGGNLRSAISYLPDVHRLLPQSPEAEKGVLGSILLSPKIVLGDCIEKNVTPEHFHIPAHGAIYGVLIDLWSENQPIDFITLTQVLRDRNLLEQCGGAAFITDLFTFIPTAANASYYVEIVQEKYTLRRIIVTCTEYAARSYDEQEEVRSLLDEVEQRVYEIAKDRYKDRVRNMKEQVMEAIESIEKLYERKGGITGLATGFSALDKLTDGLHKAEMIVIAARPSMGKTALAMNIAEHVALEGGKAVAIFSLEMSSQQLIQRMLCSLARVNLQRVRDGFLSDRDFPSLTSAASKLSQAKILIDDTAGLSILELRAKARRLKSQNDIQLIVIDYLQLLKSDSRRAKDNRQLEISEISSGIKALSKELDLPILVLAQLNRQPEARTGGKPRLSDLRESGSIEQDADLVGLLVRSEVYEEDEEAKAEKAGEAELIIAKQRNGPVGEIPLTFLREFTRFETRARQKE